MVSNTVIIASVSVISLVVVITVIPLIVDLIMKQKRHIVIKLQLSNDSNNNDFYDIVGESNHYQITWLTFVFEGE